MTTPQAKYDKNNTIVITMKLNKRTDQDILVKLEESGNKQGYIKSLIRRDIYETERVKKELVKEYGEKTVEVMKIVVEEVGMYADETITIENIINGEIEKNYLTVNKGVSGNSYVWYYDGTDNVIYNLETDVMLNEKYDEKEISELLCNEFNIED